METKKGVHTLQGKIKVGYRIKKEEILGERRQKKGRELRRIMKRK